MHHFRPLVLSSIACALFLACAAKQTPKVTEAPPPPPAPAVAVNPTPPPPPPTSDLSDRLRDYTLHFDFDRDNLTSDSQQRLQQLSELMRSNRTTKVQISGNCDERGTEEYNLALGQRRAAVAKQYLVNLGVDPNRIDTVSYGKERPAVPGHNEAAWAENRRDEFSPLK